jgi:acetylornithine deacetylase
VSAASELLSRLVAIDSVNPSLVPGGAGEGEIAAFVAGWLERAGLDVTVEEAAPGRPNVIGVVRGRGDGRSLMLNAHMDTVGVEGMERPFEPRLEDGRLFGRGAYDMKGSLAAMMLAAERAARGSRRGDLVLAAVCDEEHASLGTDALVARHGADGCVVTEPTGGWPWICVAHKGFVWLEAETRGRAAHGSLPHEGVDAIAAMGHVLVGLERLGERLAAGAGHPLLGTGSVHASLIEGGQELSSYPERCLLSVERRTVPGETPAVVHGELRELVGERGSARVTFSREPFEVAVEEEIVALARAELERVTGEQPRIVGSPAWMDSAITSAAGIPTVVFGPDGAGAHAAVEWVELGQVEKCAEALLGMAEVFCA